MPTIEELDQVHPAFTYSYHRELYSLYRGGQTWEAKDWIPRQNGEPMDDYALRLAGVEYVNRAGPIVDTFGQWLFEDPLRLGDRAHERLVRPAEGSPTLDVVVAQALTNAIIHRRGWVYVTWPDTGPVESRLEQERAGGDRPVFRCIDPLAVIDWKLDAAGGVVWAITREIEEDRQDGVGMRRYQVRWSRITRTEVTTWSARLAHDQVAQAGVPGKLASADAFVSAGVTEETRGGVCPLVCLELPEGLWAMDRMAGAAVSVIRAQAALDWSLDRSAYALLTMNLKSGRQAGDALPAVGPGYGMTLDLDEKAGYVEPAGRAYDALRSNVRDYMDALYHVTRQMAMSSSVGGAAGGGAAGSGASKMRDMDPMRMVLAAYRGQAVRCAARLVSLVATALEQKVAQSAVEVTGMDAWRERTLAEFFSAVTLAGGAVAMSETLTREVAKAQATLLLQGQAGEARLDDIHAEIEAADVGLFGMGGGMGMGGGGMVPGGGMPGVGSDTQARMEGKEPKVKDPNRSQAAREGQEASGQGDGGVRRTGA